MSLDGLQIGALAGALGSLGAASLALFNGVFSTQKATRETITWLQEDNKIARAREREAIEQRDEAREQRDEARGRIRELEDTVRIHHSVIRGGHEDLTAMLYRTDLPADVAELIGKARDKLDTRIR